MSKLSAPVGAIVRVWFPESEDILKPGPKFRPCLVIAEEVRNGHPMVLVVYGTSQNTDWSGNTEVVVNPDGYTAIKTATKFCFQRAFWLPLQAKYFLSNGRQPLRENLRREHIDLCKRPLQASNLFR